MPTETKSIEKPAKAPTRDAAGATSARSGQATATLLTTAGNLAIQRFADPRLQRKPRLSTRGDIYEEEADRISQHVVSRISVPTVQRKCVCGGEGECDECKRKAAAQSVAVKRKTDELYVQRFSVEENAPGPVGTTGTVAAAAPSAATPGLIVEDAATDLGTGQMKKSEFLGQLRGPVTSAAQTALQGTMWSTLGSLAIDPWFQYYSRQSAQQLERSIQGSVPGSAGVTNAGAYVPLVSARVQSAVGEWARTGKVPPGVPAGLPGMDLPGAGILSSIGGAVSGLVQGAKDVVSSIGSGISSLAQSAGNALSSIGGLLFKAKEGGPRSTDDPRAIQTQLDSGDALEGNLQSRMSSAFGYDFSGVRVHKDNRAAQLSADLNARAFTVGNNVAFGAGEYQPGSPIGDALIAHELAHVVQQGGASGHVPLQKGEAEGSLEEDADVSAVRAVASLWSGAKAGLANIGRNAIPALKSGLKLQSCKKHASVTQTTSPEAGTVPPAPEEKMKSTLEGAVTDNRLAPPEWETIGTEAQKLGLIDLDVSRILRNQLEFNSEAAGEVAIIALDSNPTLRQLRTRYSTGLTKPPRTLENDPVDEFLRQCFQDLALDKDEVLALRRLNFVLEGQRMFDALKRVGVVDPTLTDVLTILNLSQSNFISLATRPGLFPIKIESGKDKALRATVNLRSVVIQLLTEKGVWFHTDFDTIRGFLRGLTGTQAAALLRSANLGQASSELIANQFTSEDKTYNYQIRERTLLELEFEKSDAGWELKNASKQNLLLPWHPDVGVTGAVPASGKYTNAQDIGAYSFNSGLVTDHAQQLTFTVQKYDIALITTLDLLQDPRVFDLVSQVLSPIPSPHLGLVRKIVLDPGVFPDRVRDGDAANGIINIYLKNRGAAISPRELSNTSAHEVGHVVSEQGANRDPNFWANWDQAMKDDQVGVSRYGFTNDKEDFAETYTLYLYDRSSAKSKYPHRSAIVSKLFNE